MVAIFSRCERENLLAAGELISKALADRFRNVLEENSIDADIETFIAVLYLTSSSAHLEYISAVSRTNSFPENEWEQIGNGQPIWRFVEAGFFFVEDNSDHVKCYFCNLGLKDWSTGDDPMVEHARFSPLCFHLKSLRGLRYLREIAAMHPRPEPVNFPQVYSQRNHGGLLDNIAKMWISDAIVAIRSVGICPSRILHKISRTWIRERRQITDVADVVSNLQDDAVDVLQLPDFTSHIEAYCKFMRHRDSQSPSERPPSSPVSAAVAAAAALPLPSTTPASSAEAVRQRALLQNSSSPLLQQLDQTRNSSSANVPPAKTEASNSQQAVTTNKKCVVCEEKDFEITCLPCGHLCLCQPCSVSARNCPVCSLPIRGHVRTYLT